MSAAAVIAQQDVTRHGFSVGAPMPFASTLRDQFVSSQAKGRWATHAGAHHHQNNSCDLPVTTALRGKMDWSAIALGVSEQAGVDVSQHLPR